MDGAIAIWGSWHLGSVHAAGLAELGNRVLVTDPDDPDVLMLQMPCAWPFENATAA